MPRVAQDVARASNRDAEARLKGFIEKFTPQHRTLIRRVRRTLRTRFPTATEMVYDNYNFFVIGYSPTDRPSDAIVSLVAGANGVSVCFIHGARIADPKGILQGAGKQTRFIRVDSPTVLELPAVHTLLTAAVDLARVPFKPVGAGKLVIRSVSAKQRPRRAQLD